MTRTADVTYAEDVIRAGRDPGPDPGQGAVRSWAGDPGFVRRRLAVTWFILAGE